MPLLLDDLLGLGLPVLTLLEKGMASALEASKLTAFSVYALRAGMLGGRASSTSLVKKW